MPSTSRSSCRMINIGDHEMFESVSDLPIDSKSRLRIFLCHASSDKAQVRDLYQRLNRDGFQPWLDEEDLLPGMDWGIAIPKAVRNSDVVLVCLSRRATNKEGYIQKEIKFALDRVDEMPEDTIFLVPLKLETCEIPERLTRWQWVDLFQRDGYAKLISALQRRARSLGMIDARPSATHTTVGEHWLVITEFTSGEEFTLVNGARIDN